MPDPRDSNIEQIAQGGMSTAGIGSFRYIKIQFDNEAERTQTKETVNHACSISIVSSQPRYQAEFQYIERTLLSELLIRQNFT